MRAVSILTAAFLIFGCHSKKDSVIATEPLEPTWQFSNFEKVDSINPILKPSTELTFVDPITHNTVQWEARNVLNPTAVVKDGNVYLLYRAQDSTGTSRIGMAVSEDGLHFNKMPHPVFYPDQDAMKRYEWNYRKDNSFEKPMEACVSCYFDGVEDPRILKGEDERYIMTYTSYDGKTARLSLASSTDLMHWTKHGLVLADEKYADTWSKSGAIVGELKGGNVTAKKINGTYWMYFGDTSLFMATSEDLVKWKALEDLESGKMIAVLHPRAGYFDSRLVEPGPFALYKNEGIVLIYNSSNAENCNDATLPKFTYAAGQALFDDQKPYQLLERSRHYFIHPEKDYEKLGEVNEVCFVEGLVFFKERWFLYYGTADSKIAVAVYQPPKKS
ncbi:MAG TPA: glycoside hydrolase family 130 protein [Flavobacteriaceae bacterium]|nr:glycosidase [Flavobacteriaceae bacterium]MCB9212720.1 glycosidase [Alteromonas sp.]HPF11765.1 glycoside hydrolase family 130 protein [Flavobacteriaceae bacterium]HQU20791.1 glycoside hydrolase family 130 protein [Flavobacteriaceae bacterium]HQU64966.1 glycoside hydrolase family 130 protein [Flavobacteriaceae bacterium]